MGGLCWLLLVLALFPSPPNILAAVDQSWLTSIVAGIKNEYELGDSFSVAVNIPRNQDPDSLQQVLQNDPADRVKEAISQASMYKGTRVVAATQPHALTRVLQNIRPLIKSSDGNVLVIYSEGSPGSNDNGITSSINDITHNWGGYAFAFSNVADVPASDTSQLTQSFKRLHIAKLGLNNIFRCYEPGDDTFQCTTCSSGGDVAPSCVQNTALSSQEQGTRAETPKSGLGTGLGYGIGTGIGAGIGAGIGTHIGNDIGTDIGNDIGTDIGNDIDTGIGSEITAGSDRPKEKGGRMSECKGRRRGSCRRRGGSKLRRGGGKRKKGNKLRRGGGKRKKGNKLKRGGGKRKKGNKLRRGGGKRKKGNKLKRGGGKRKKGNKLRRGGGKRKKGNKLKRGGGKRKKGNKLRRGGGKRKKGNKLRRGGKRKFRGGRKRSKTRRGSRGKRRNKRRRHAGRRRWKKRWGMA
ncbi:uncharacterized protein LOC115787012 isoform X3 [Archocentrus centrarchus]|uniref:uncharacterized protein LOC115787012 isoform X3 n=1 Tax=Archocentrus centrarchus TaxID=63155 RepID=UPI0011EA1F80|nr:uncharacterized protein LOC115787012 isoform X3 [Archocentrus centrarchus]